MANPVVHFEVTGKDGKKLQDFYSNVFGWKINADNPMNYGIVDAGETGGGIGGGISAGDGGTRQVTFYISVDDPQAYLDKVESKGGKTVMPVTEIPGMVILAQFADPEGNVVGLVKAGYPGQASIKRSAMIKGFEGVIISTEDFARLLPFYRDTLGLGTQMESDGFAVLAGGQLALGQHSEVKGRSRDPNRVIVNLSVDNCQVEYERLKGRGVKFIREPSKEAQDLIIATFLDPDGNTLQLFEWG